ncbi:unnamed protein product [Clonostachys solani]|uniref:Uncharacterized protein n=1 Tax=Clonostachys solani TaxID=160281 RepID=A0A9N9Z3D8_9HYPO|nr:unnamed protein product [Clonostachys solani]
MLPSPCLTGLPIEVRLQIYQLYFHCPGGLLYSHDSQKLHAKDPDEKFEVSLIFTCRTIAAETQGLPFEFNTITFTTGCHIKNYSHAGEYSRILHALSTQRFKVLCYMRPAISEEIYEEVTSRFPRFTPVLDAIRQHPPLEGGDNWNWISEISRWGDVPFHTREATVLTCQLALLLMEKEAVAAVARFLQGHPDLPPHNDPLRILTIDHKPWDIPSESELRRLEAALHDQSRGDSAWAQGVKKVHGAWRSSSQHPRPYHFSAATTAIQFLRQMSVEQRMHLRNIVLREDSKSVAYPACHARGLIPFCQQNPHLHIERRVSLFGNILEVPDGLFPAETRSRSDLSKALAVWLAEAMDLGPAGMPPNAFSFVLDDDQAPDRARITFDRVFQRSLTTQLHFEALYERSGQETRDFFQMTKNELYILDGFPRAIEELFRNNGILRCSFSPGELGEDGRVPQSTLPPGDDFVNIVEDVGFNMRSVRFSFSDCIGEIFGHTEFPGLL